MKNMNQTYHYIAKDDRMCCCMGCLFTENNLLER